MECGYWDTQSIARVTTSSITRMYRAQRVPQEHQAGLDQVVQALRQIDVNRHAATVAAAAAGVAAAAAAVAVLATRYEAKYTARQKNLGLDL